MHRQLRPILFAIALASFAGAARADGYEAPRAVAEPVMLQVSNWTGFYANGGVGYGLLDAQTTLDVAGTCLICTKTDHGGRGWLGEVGIGYDYQITDKIVIGALFNYDFSDINGQLDVSGVSGKTNNDSTWFVGARAGWLMTPAVLNYWSVGYTQTHFGGTSLVPDGPGGPAGSIQLESYTAGGWFLGGGLEVAMHDGWFWRSEVRYSEYSKDARVITGAPVASAALNFEPVVETATSEIVYKFNWGQ